MRLVPNLRAALHLLPSICPRPPSTVSNRSQSCTGCTQASKPGRGNPISAAHTWSLFPPSPCSSPGFWGSSGQKVELCHSQSFGPHLTFTECHWGRLRGLTVRAAVLPAGGAVSSRVVEAEKGRWRAGRPVSSPGSQALSSLSNLFPTAPRNLSPVCCARPILKLKVLLYILEI